MGITDRLKSYMCGIDVIIKEEMTSRTSKLIISSTFSLTSVRFLFDCIKRIVLS